MSFLPHRLNRLDRRPCGIRPARHDHGPGPARRSRGDPRGRQPPDGATQWILTDTRLPGFDGGSLYLGRHLAGGVFFVADGGHHRIAVVGPDGRVERTFGAPGQRRPAGPAARRAARAARDPGLYVAVLEPPPGGVHDGGDPSARGWPPWTGRPSSPHAVAVAPNGDVYVLSDGSRRVERFTWDAPASGFGGAGNGPEQLAGPNDPPIAAGSRITVADTARCRRRPDGAARAALSIATSAGALIDRIAFKGIRDVAVHPDTGEIYVLHNSPSGDRDQITILGGNLAQVGVVSSSSLPEAARFAPAERLALNVGGRLGLTSAATGDPARPQQGVRQYVTGRDLPVQGGDAARSAGRADPVRSGGHRTA
ncbi:MAG: hypothetical protein U0470_00995 [Anaerolineae bacterium]